MSDKYALLRRNMPELVAEAKRQGGINPRAQLIIDLLAERDELTANVAQPEPGAEWKCIDCGQRKASKLASATGKLRVMGEIETADLDDERHCYPMALLIEFDSPEAIRKAIADGRCNFTWFDLAPRTDTATSAETAKA